MKVGERLQLALDALRGREGLRATSAELKEFYSDRYVSLNPEMDQQDAPAKARALVGVLGRVGVTSPQSVLEVGCGSGAVMKALREHLGATAVLGVDYGVHQAHVAKQLTGMSIAVAQGSELPFRSGQFSVAYVADVLEHVLDPLAVLRELSRVSEYVGFLVPIEAGIVSSPLYAYRRWGGRPTNREKYGHVWRWFRFEIESMLACAQLRIEAMTVVGPEGRAHYGTKAGRAVEMLRQLSRRVSPMASEMLFGGRTLVGVARRQD